MMVCSRLGKLLRASNIVAVVVVSTMLAGCAANREFQFGDGNVKLPDSSATKSTVAQNVGYVRKTSAELPVSPEPPTTRTRSVRRAPCAFG